jgi:prepilin-type processing-associated H-X9-DG protein/prepilin-type N-terminal cleavage/methylation domain-containing protein
MSMNRPQAFTLVELLVVAAILAVLMSILLPGLGQARAAAKMAVCASNVRQIALANDLYAGDHEQCYCPGAADFVRYNLQRWHGARTRPSEPFRSERGPLAAYLGPSGQIRTCPALHIALPDDDPRRFEKNCGGYGYNLAYLGCQMDKTETELYQMVTDLVGVQTEHVARPSQTVMFADTAFVSGELIEYSFAEPRFFPTTGTRADPSLHFRHNGTANVAWCDGHVDRERLSFSWSSGLFRGDPRQVDVGWFGATDDNGYFELN